MSTSTSSAPERATSDHLIGQELFGGYRVIKRLGEGSMGAVYLAHQESIGQSIALKVLRGRAARNAETIARFHREAKVIGMMTHPNIVRVHLFGRLDTLHYMAMEYVHGQQLEQRMAAGLMSEARIIKIMKQTLSALAEAHDLGVIHRDLKPENILLTEFRGEQDFVKILDFGIAKILQGDEESAAGEAIDDLQLTQTGMVYGTPYYLSPEQARADKLDARTDIYSLGCILYELMTGQKPFDGDTAAIVVRRQAFEEPTPARELAPERIAPGMAAIIERAMAKEPDARFSSAMEMFDALLVREQELVDQGVISGRATYVPGSEVTEPGALSAGTVPGAMRSAQPSADSSLVVLQRSSAMLIVGGAVFVFTVMIAMIMWLVLTH